MADQFGVPVTEYADTAFKAELAPKFSYGCAVFLDTDRVNFQKEGFSKEELLAGLAQVLPKNVWQYVVQIPRLAALGTQVTCSRAARSTTSPPSRRRSTTSRSACRAPRSSSTRTPAKPARSARRSRRCASSSARARSTLHRHRCGDRPRVHDEERRRDGLSLLPERVQAHVHRHEAPRRLARAATSPASPARRAPSRARRRCSRSSPSGRRSRKQFPNLVDYEAKRAFRTSTTPRRCPTTGTPIKDVERQEGLLRHQARRDHAALPALERGGAGEAPRRVRIGIPRVLNIYSTAPFFRHLLRGARHPEAERRLQRRDDRRDVGRGRQVRLDRPVLPVARSRRRTSTTCSSTTTPDEEAAQLHLLPDPHARARASSTDTMDNASCPIVAGAPDVMKAAFTKEVDFFAHARHRVPRPGALVRRAEPHGAAHVRDLGPAPRHHRGRERPRAAARRGRRSTHLRATTCRRRAARSSRPSRPRTASRS